MDSIDSLTAEHALLRRLAKEVEKALGPQHGVGWDDRAACDMTALRAAQRRFQSELKEHETREKKVIDGMLEGREHDREQLEAVVQRVHVSLEGMTELLRTLVDVCDGTHVYAVRTMMERIREELESHLTYEEEVLFPLLRRRVAARPSSMRR